MCVVNALIHTCAKDELSYLSLHYYQCDEVTSLFMSNVTFTDVQGYYYDRFRSRSSLYHI